VRSLQPARELAANKRKKMKDNKSKIAFICFHKFSESGLFNALQGIQIKKSLSFQTRVSGCGRNASTTIFLSRAAGRQDAKIRLRE
jgi:hypothetical protein